MGSDEAELVVYAVLKSHTDDTVGSSESFVIKVRLEACVERFDSKGVSVEKRRLDSGVDAPSDMSYSVMNLLCLDSGVNVISEASYSVSKTRSCSSSSSGFEIEENSSM